jgi:hypothetical protein
MHGGGEDVVDAGIVSMPRPSAQLAVEIVGVTVPQFADGRQAENGEVRHHGLADVAQREKRRVIRQKQRRIGQLGGDVPYRRPFDLPSPRVGYRPGRPVLRERLPRRSSAGSS